LDTEWCIGPSSPPPKLLRELMDRKMQPGLSAGAIWRIVGLLWDDHEWYGKTEDEVMEWRKAHEEMYEW